MPYFYLFLAILSETIATSALKMSEGFTKLYPSLVVVIGYSISFYLLSIVMKYLPIGVTYAIWSGVGIVFITLIGAYLYKQHIDAAAIIGMGLIIAGIVVIRLYSTMHVE
ncbi:MAG: multidrug efflux SMR transporter [Campylobacterales bacterium]|nr:multidrug efflux SMR transporter [Campylobacterales bacterium]